jgi:TFIIF-interacting CTD phosphatase-like protein
MKDRHIVLDLDQTLISSELVKGMKPDLRKKMKLFNYSIMDNYYYIFERPGLQSFLTYLFKNYKVSIWTAASKDYALFIIEKIILAGRINRKIEWIFYSYHCDISEKLMKSIKNLSLLSDVFRIDDFDDRTFIFDDNDEVYKAQPKQCLIAKPFYFTNEGSENDNYLEQVEDQLKTGKSIISINKRLLI